MYVCHHLAPKRTTTTVKGNVYSFGVFWFLGFLIMMRCIASSKTAVAPVQLSGYSTEHSQPVAHCLSRRPPSTDLHQCFPRPRLRLQLCWLRSYFASPGSQPLASVCAQFTSRPPVVWLPSKSLHRLCLKRWHVIERVTSELSFCGKEMYWKYIHTYNSGFFHRQGMLGPFLPGQTGIAPMPVCSIPSNRWINPIIIDFRCQIVLLTVYTAE